MQPYWELACRSLERQVTYRAAAFAGLVTNFFFGILRAAVMVALYQGREEIAGLNLAQAVTFTGLSQALIGTMSFFGWYDLMNHVYSGAIATELLKPMSLYTYWLAQDLGRAIGSFFLRGLPIMIAYGFLLEIIVPDSLLRWGCVFLAMIFSWLVSFSYRFILNLASFWTPNALGIARLGFMLTWFLSGFMFPLKYFPDWFIGLCNLTPFPHMVNTLVEIYLGAIDGWGLVKALGLQLAWIIGLILLGQWILHRGITRLVIVGG
jgi:ABC-2 type transport system permease protein